MIFEGGRRGVARPSGARPMRTGICGRLPSGTAAQTCREYADSTGAVDAILADFVERLQCPRP